MDPRIAHSKIAIVKLKSQFHGCGLDFFVKDLQNLTRGISMPLNMMKIAPISSNILGARFK